MFYINVSADVLCQCFSRCFIYLFHVNVSAVVEVNNEPDFEKLSLEEKIRLREQIKADKLAARIAQNEELKKKREEEKLKRKEERDKVKPAES